MKIKIAIIISNLNKAVSHEWFVKRINREKFEPFFILMNPGNSDLELFLRGNGISTSRIIYRGKKDLIKAIIFIFTFVVRNRIDIVHTHLFDANIAGLLAAYLARVNKRIYTRHHSTYHHIYFPGAVKYDKFANFLATGIIAVSKNVNDVLIKKEKVNPEKVHLIHHGFLFEEFENISEERIQRIKIKYNFANRYPVVGVISRYTRWKGIDYIIPAFKRVSEIYPHSVLVLANAKGDYAGQIALLLKDLNKNSYREIIFENDFPALYKCFDVFAHTPIDNHSEAFGQIYVESLASKIPSVFTLSGVAPEFIMDRRNALVVPFKNSLAIFEAIYSLLNDSDLSRQLGANGYNDVHRLFDIEMMMSKLSELYVK